MRNVSADISAGLRHGTAVDIEPGPRWSERTVWGHRYARCVISTPWLEPGDDLVSTVVRHTPDRRPGDTVAVSEKVAVLLTGGAVPIDSVLPGMLADVLARAVRPRSGSRGLSVPEKMEYVLQASGRGRILVAAAAGAVTRPLGIRGMFYRLAGSIARDLDGGRPPYEGLLFPPLTASTAKLVCQDLENALGTGAAVVDLNDFGGTVRAVSERALPAQLVADVLADNPLRQRLTGTPIALVRPGH